MDIIKYYLFVLHITVSMSSSCHQFPFVNVYVQTLRYILQLKIIHGMGPYSCSLARPNMIEHRKGCTYHGSSNSYKIFRIYTM